MGSIYKLSPSKAHRYLECPQSLEYDLPFIETPATIRGNNLHTWAEKRLRVNNEQYFTDFADEHEFNDYERFLIDGYVKAVLEEKFSINAHRMIVEQKENINIYDNSINLIVDTLLLARNSASIIDLKTGNVDVDVEDNEQLYFYGYMVVMKHKNIKRVRLSIFQKGRMKTIEATRDEILNFFIDKQDVFEAISKNELYYNPSDKACRFCAHKDKCLARAKWIINRSTGGKNE